VSLDVEVENRSGWTIDPAQVQRVVSEVLRGEAVDSGEVGVSFVATDEMAELNAEHRGKASATDVLSFPIDELGPVGEGLPRQLGDLVVCPDVAEADGTPIGLLLVHGALHLVGYDHERDDGEMMARQEAAAARVGTVDAKRP
jgi:probable rRNA maturation factor